MKQPIKTDHMQVQRISTTPKIEPSKGRILFANMPLDGHFHPLTGIAMHLVNEGYEVRWYSGKVHHEKIRSMGIPVYPFRKAMDVDHDNLEEAFPERKRYKSQVSKLKFDIKNYFILRSPEFYEDIKDIQGEYPFDLLVCDVAFTGSVFVKDLLKKPVVAIGVIPLAESSKDLPPNGIGLTPSKSIGGRVRDAILRFVAGKLVFKEAGKLMNDIFKRYGMPAFKGIVFDVLVHKADLLLQSGVPGFEYKRRDMSRHVRFVGALLPYSKSQVQPFDQRGKLLKYKKVILATQGTVERDIEKLLVPTLEAFKDSEHCVVVTTGGHQTAQLRKRYPQEHFIIEDFIDFREVMPLADVYITNGGYGGVNLAIQHKLPMVVAGIHEGKNEINARVGYFNLGINLKTEKPTPGLIRQGVQNIFDDPKYKSEVIKMSQEFSRYNTYVLTEQYIRQLFQLIRKPVGNLV
jgi:UDP:flavonoid glycosyltransferase YjiC (YdhE family)